MIVSKHPLQHSAHYLSSVQGRSHQLGSGPVSSVHRPISQCMRSQFRPVFGTGRDVPSLSRPVPGFSNTPVGSPTEISRDVICNMTSYVRTIWPNMGEDGGGETSGLRVTLDQRHGTVSYGMACHTICVTKYRLLWLNVCL